MTKYAAQQPSKDMFAESFMLFYSDREWLMTNQPDLYRFFYELDKTVKFGPVSGQGEKP